MLSIAPLVWGEIPVSDMNRAIAFYQQHFGVEFSVTIWKTWNTPP